MPFTPGLPCGPIGPIPTGSVNVCVVPSVKEMYSLVLSADCVIDNIPTASVSGQLCCWLATNPGKHLLLIVQVLA